MNEGHPINIFVDLVRENHKEGMKVCEIGAWMGATTKAYLPIVRENRGRVTVIDHFRGNYLARGGEVGAFVGKEGSEEVYKIFCDNVRSYLDMIDIYRRKSTKVAKLIPEKSLDICFID